MNIPDNLVEPHQRIIQSVVSYHIKEHKSSVLKEITGYEIQGKFKLLLLNCELQEKNHWQ
jgi:hypothetical protein